MRRAPSEQCDYVFEGSAADCYIEIHRAGKVKKSNISGCSAVGSAPALGAGCRGFESLHSDQKRDCLTKKFDNPDFIILGQLLFRRAIFYHILC